MAKDTIKRKIAALRAKTTSAGCTEDEALAAAALAARLMQEHGLSEGDIELVTERARVAVAMPQWQRWLSSVICKCTNTHAIAIKGDIREIEFAGKEHAVEIALYLRDVLTRAVNAEIRALRKSPLYRRKRTAASKTDVVNSFAAGMVARLSLKLHELFAGTISAQERAIAEGHLADKYPSARRVPVRSTGLKNGAAFFAGQRAGESVQLSHGVAATGAPPLMIGGAS